jgi:DhnA family fructose-bisphosphate aldolase class Ia
MHINGDWRELDNLGIWKVQIKHLSSEDSISKDGYCGYVAIDALMSHSNSPDFNHGMVKTVRDRPGRLSIAKNVLEAVKRTSAISMRENLGTHLDHRAITTAARVANELEADTVFPSLPMESWMSSVIFNGLNDTHKFKKKVLRWVVCFFVSNQDTKPISIDKFSSHPK